MTSAPAETDAQLLCRLDAGEGAALRLLVARHGPSLQRYVRGLVGEAAADDALQETFAAAFRAAASFRGDGSAKAWLFSIARNACYHMRQRRLDEPRADEDLETLGSQAGWGDETTPEQLFACKEQLEVLNGTLAALDPLDREVLLLRDVEGLSGETTAQLLGIGLAAMKSRLHRARLRLLASFPNGEVAP